MSCGDSRVVAFIVMLVALRSWGAVRRGQSTGGTGYESAAERRAKAEKRYAIRAVPGATATSLPDGIAAAPVDAPPQVHAAISAANRIIGKPYQYGGGHAKVEDSGYDCSGTVSTRCSAPSC